jgi:aromatic-L-amino-acid decarboxylase
MLWRTGPAATELELRCCDWIRQMLHLPVAFEGHIEDTASVSTLVALAAARHRATEGRVRDNGLHGLPAMRIYCSEHAHSSVDRAALILGLGMNAVRRIPVDEDYRMRSERLESAIAEDRAAGCVPMAVVATTGTTVTASVDPVMAIADLCEREGIWLHVDAAYGGAMALVERYRSVFDGVDRADSLVVNPHKWWLVPMDCSVFLSRDNAAVREALSLVPPYLMTPEDDVARNLMDYGPALGRRFRSLKLWFVLRWFGARRIAAIVEHQVEIARRFASWVEADAEWEVVAPVPMSLVLVRHRPPGVEDEAQLQAHNERILEAVNSDGRSFLSHTVLERRGQKVYSLRVAVGNVRTQQSHLRGLWERLQEAAAHAD